MTQEQDWEPRLKSNLYEKVVAKRDYCWLKQFIQSLLDDQRKELEQKHREELDEILKDTIRNLIDCWSVDSNLTLKDAQLVVKEAFQAKLGSAK